MSIHRFLYIALALVAASCGHPYNQLSSFVQSTVNPHLVGDGITDDRPALQEALDAAGPGGVVVLPVGRYSISQHGTDYWGLSLPAGVTLQGVPGAVLLQAPGTLGAVSLISISGAGAALRDLEIDGQDKLQNDVTPNGPGATHRFGVIVSAPNVIIAGVTAQHFTGDGLYAYVGANFLTVYNVKCLENDRNGITLGGGTSGTIISDSKFSDNRAQQVDSEPVGDEHQVDNVLIDRVTIGRSRSKDWGLTISGPSSAARSKHWVVRNSTIDGGIFVVWTKDVQLEHVRVTSDSPHPALQIYRTSSDVRVYDSELTSTVAPSVISIVGTSPGGPPTEVRIVRNVLTLSGVAGNAVTALGAGDVEISDNELRGAGIVSTVGAGIVVRATVSSTDPAMQAGPVTIRRNRFVGWSPVGVAVWGNGDAQLKSIDISDNVFDGTGSSMLAAMSLNDGTDAAKRVQQVGNVLLGVATLVRDFPAGDQTSCCLGDRWATP